MTQESNKTLNNYITKYVLLESELTEARREVKRLRGALENILNALESDDDCMDIAALHIAEEALFGE
jgi:DNA-binding FrmR family transcriptional regulator